MQNETPDEPITFDSLEDLLKNGAKLTESKHPEDAMVGRMLIALMPPLHQWIAAESELQKQNPDKPNSAAMESALANLCTNAFDLCFAGACCPACRFSSFNRVIAHFTMITSKRIAEDFADNARPHSLRDPDFPDATHRGPGVAN